MAVSPTNSSNLILPASQVIDWQGDKSLRNLLITLICESLLENVTEAIWLHDADGKVAEVASSIGPSRNIQVFLTASSPKVVSGTTYIHENTPRRALESLVPRNVQKLVYFDVDGGSVLEDLLPAFAHRIKAAVQYPNQYISKYGTVPLRFGTSRLYELLAVASSQRPGLKTMETNSSEEHCPVQLNMANRLSRVKARQRWLTGSTRILYQ